MMLDFKRLKQIYRLSRDISRKDVQLALNEAKSNSFAAREYIMKEGDQNRDVHFILKGLLRTFVVNEQGEEITTGLRWDYQFYMNTDVLFFEEKSRFYVQVLEPTKTLSMSFDRVQELLQERPELEHYRKMAIRDAFKSTIKQAESFMLLSPEERYLNYIEQQPNIVNRVPDKYIANILGITPVSLSRIRKRIATRK